MGRPAAEDPDARGQLLAPRGLGRGTVSVAGERKSGEQGGRHRLSTSADMPSSSPGPSAPPPGKMIAVEFKNFKSYGGRVVIGPFGDFSAVIGPNGAGECSSPRCWKLRAAPASGFARRVAAHSRPDHMLPTSPPQASPTSWTAFLLWSVSRQRTCEASS
jgi:hypothetical protein